MHVVAHGGAGSDPDEPEPRREVLDEAVERGRTATMPIEAVVETVRVLESNPRFNAGTGSAVQSDGTIRTDAGLMTSDREVGAACSMPGVEHAVEVARVVHSETPHVLLASDHAVDLAADFEVATDVDLWTATTRERWQSLSPPEGSPREHLRWVREQFGGTDTVGAVASDGETVAAATSTGGRWCALAGRVGDVPQIGSGFYATPAGGASATGAGEDIARVTLSRVAVEYLADGHDAQAAADAAIDYFTDHSDGDVGIIVLTPDGDVGSAYDSPGMQTSRTANSSNI
ncbi:isoaspartyl peptidase/L-asparaginase [Haloarculaceae archaeon H-GB1-1]|nr:isoaspartyl peptidase/L-asparaginase [Haloarculaceae archaeon H-GB1-1]